LRLVLSNGPYWVGAFLSLHLRAKMDLVSKNLCFFKYKMMTKCRNSTLPREKSKHCIPATLILPPTPTLNLNLVAEENAKKVL
jgi:hypothetical protein